MINTYMSRARNRFYFPNKQYYDDLVAEMGGQEPPCVVFSPRLMPFNPVTAGANSFGDIVNAVERVAAIALKGSNRSTLKSNMTFITMKDIQNGIGILKSTTKDKKNNDVTTTESVGGSGGTDASGLGYVSDKDGIDDDEDSPISLIFPLRPMQIGLTHTWTDDIDMISGAFSAVTQGIATGLSSKVSEALGTSDALKIGNSNGGAYTYSLTRKTYGGTNLQQLSYNFEYVPRNDKEASLVIYMIQMLRYLSMPQSPPNQETNPVPIGRIPAIWTIKYFALPQGMLKKNNTYDFMVCNGIAVDYGDGEFYSGFKYQNNNSGGTSEVTLFPNVIKISFTMDEFFSNQSAQDYYGDLNSSTAS